MQNNNGVKERFLDCFLKILDKKRKKWRELLPDQYLYVCQNLIENSNRHMNEGLTLLIELPTPVVNRYIWKSIIARKPITRYIHSHLKFQK